MVLEVVIQALPVDDGRWPGMPNTAAGLAGAADPHPLQASACGTRSGGERESPPTRPNPPKAPLPKGLKDAPPAYRLVR